ncbi:MAG: phage antirepressor [Pyramidobacter sp.]|uniref:phage antirepressor n=1 Tax=Pyramidobacter sp. TaxID=1943581 RepID=UPI0025E84E09|nr:phage antirepressor [Pyramidobacter sp.]MCI7403912.1 phage antirepressor [Pyramidobacter sp.]
MNELQVFDFKGQSVRSVMVDGAPWWVAKDVCEVLGLDIASGARGLEDDEKALQIMQTLGGSQEMTIISEAGLYSLILRSRKPEAKEFKRWITHEVLPAIRKHGAYMTPETLEKALTNPDFIIRLATELKQEQERRQALEAQHRIDQPKAFFADAVRTSETCINIGDLAKLIDQNGVPMGRTRLFKWLRANGWLMKSGNEINSPTQKGRKYGFFKIKENTIVKPSGEVLTTKTTRVTGKGQIYFINLFCNPLEKEQIRAAE